MIKIDTNLGMSPSFFHLLLKLKKKYRCSDKNIDNYTQAHAAKGANKADKTNNADATGQVNDIKLKENLDYQQLIKDLKLNLPENKFAILMMMPTSELYQMLELLDKKHLLSGLKFFTKDKLMGLIAHLPKKDLLKMLFTMFTDRKQLIENLPTKELYRFLGSNKIDKRQFMNVFEMLPKETLSTIAGYLTGKPCDKMSRPDLLQEVGAFKKYQLINGIKKLDEKTLRGFITTMAESSPKLYNEFSHVSLYNVTSKFAKTDLIDSMKVIDNSKIMGMLTELPDKLLALTVSQIDPAVFAHLLLNKHKGLLANLVLA